MYNNCSSSFKGSSITEHRANDDSLLNCSASSNKATIADMNMKLAMKDAEIQKLQASLTARSAAQQKSIAGMLFVFCIHFIMVV